MSFLKLKYRTLKKNQPFHPRKINISHPDSKEYYILQIYLCEM